MGTFITTVIPEGLQKPGGVSVTSTHLMLAVGAILLLAALTWLLNARRR